MPVGTPRIKILSTRSYGAEVIVHGEAFDDACDLALQLAETRGLTFVHPFDDPAVIAGQGTIAREILSQAICSGIDAVICPVGGSGLISGVATYIKETDPSIEVVGVEAASIASLKAAIEQGGPVQLPAAHPRRRN